MEDVVRCNRLEQSEVHVFDAEYRTRESAHAAAKEWIAERLRRGPFALLIEE